MIRTPDYRLRVFVSSTLRELAEEREAARQAILQLRLAPVMFELGARPHPADDLYAAYLAQSHVFLGIYWQSYGWVAPGKKLSGLEDEYNQSVTLPRLLYIKTPAPEREPALGALLDRIRGENAGCYKSFSTAVELRELVENDLALLLTERFEATRGQEPIQEVAEHPLTNLPFPRSPLVGRERELTAGCDLLLRDDVALVTLTGPGGSGKSRLGTEIALGVRDQFPDGVYLVELDVITDPDLVIPAIARAVGAPEPVEGVDADDALRAFLCGRRLLLLLDNFEQVLAAAPRVARLLEGCPFGKVLVTSRAPLRLRAEREFPVPPLALPPAGRMPDLHPLSQYAAVQLFIQRARAAKVDFEVTSENAPAVAEICHRLDGLPLAIELAAARIRMLPPPALLRRMGQSFEVLDGGIRDLPERQRTLHATIDWSHSLLGDEEKLLFRRLAAFAGGWTFEAADAVCNSGGSGHVDVFAGLERLVDLGLVIAPQEVGGELRFRSLETIREFALQRLMDAGEDSLARQLHADFFVALTEQIDSDVAGRGQTQWADRLDSDYGNVHSALEWTEKHDAELGLRLCVAVWRHWESHSLIREGHAWLESFVAQTQGETEVRARALVATAALACYQGAYGPARKRAQQGLEVYRHLGDEPGIAHALNELGVIASYQGDYETARRSLEQSLEIKRREGSQRAIANAINNLGLVAGYQGDHQDAYSRHSESLRMYRAAGEEFGVAVALGNLGHDAMHLGRLDEASSLQIESARLFHGIGDKDGLAECFERLAMVANARRDFTSAARWFGVAEVLRQEVSTVPEAADQLEYERELDVTQRQLDATDFEAAWEEGRAMTLDTAIAVAARDDP